MNTVVLASGRGSNLRAICRAIDDGRCKARIVGVVSDRRSAAALEFADARGIPTRVVSLKKGGDRDQWNIELANQVASLSPELVVLAGFMKILGPSFLERFPGRIINVHPALLPSFPGHDGPKDALEAGVRISGCTVHIVDDGVDTGPIVAQAAVPVLPDDTPETLHARIQSQEHRLLPGVIHRIAIGDIELNPLKMKAAHTDPSKALSVPEV
jgi:phosphoribosylglycinamide formyltransferase-1